MEPEPGRRSPRLAGPARAAVLAEARSAYEGGASVRAVAASLGRSYSGTHHLLVQAGVVFRRRGGQRRG